MGFQLLYWDKISLITVNFYWEICTSNDEVETTRGFYLYNFAPGDVKSMIQGRGRSAIMHDEIWENPILLAWELTFEWV